MKTKQGDTMNDQLRTYARDTPKEGLAKCTEGEQHLFKRMYAHANLELPIDEVVDQMEDDKLDWAMGQVERTLKKNKRTEATNND
jgi:predicted nucleotidyltransferase